MLTKMFDFFRPPYILLIENIRGFITVLAFSLLKTLKFTLFIFKLKRIQGKILTDFVRKGKL